MAIIAIASAKNKVLIRALHCFAFFERNYPVPGPPGPLVFANQLPRKGFNSPNVFAITCARLTRFWICYLEQCRARIASGSRAIEHCHAAITFLIFRGRSLSTTRVFNRGTPETQFRFWEHNSRISANPYADLYTINPRVIFPLVAQAF